jgi:DNA-binding FrmR family transcriptional regulator
MPSGFGSCSGGWNSDLWMSLDQIRSWREIAMAGSKTKRHAEEHPDHSAELSRLSKITGQLHGIERMIEQKRYCPEIIQQIRAATSALRAIEMSILTEHLNQCVREAALAKDAEHFRRKIAEIVKFAKG